MGPVFTQVMETERERLRLKAEAIWVDALVVATPAGGTLVGSLPNLSVFSGSFLLDGLDNLSDDFDHWLTLERQKLEERIRQWNEINVRNSAQDQQPHQQRVEIARKAVAIDPTNEEAVRELMRALGIAGQRAQAMLEYERCRTILRSRLDIEPAPETQVLYRELRRETAREGEAPRSAPPSIPALSLRLPEGLESRAGESLGGYEARPSIAILPFREDAAGPDQVYFGDGLVDNIIHALAGLKELIVISRGSTTNYSRKPVDVLAVGRELMVRYVLLGSVQRSTENLRIGVELTDSETGAVIRANRYEGQLSDLFALQDRISEEVVRIIAPHVRQRELMRAMRKHPQSMTAYDFVLQALEPLYQLDETSFTKARELLEQAMRHDPSYAPAYSYAAYWHCYRIGQEWSPNLGLDMREASKLAAAAIERDPDDATALAIHGHVQSLTSKDFDTALRSFDQAIAACPNSAIAWIFSAATHCFLGDGRSAVRRAETGLRLSPNDSHVFFAEHILSQAHYTSGNYDEALVWARRADKRNSRLTSNLRTLAACLVAVGKFEESREVALRHQQVVPNFSLTSWAARTPMQGKMLTERIERLRAAGMPD